MRLLHSKTLVVTICIASTLLIASPGSADAQPTSLKTAKIGCSLALNMSWGVLIKQAFELCIDVINREGGVKVGNDRYAIEMVFYDDKYKPEPGIAAAQRLINVDKVRALVGSISASAVVASMPIVQQSGLPYFVGTYSEKVLDPRYKRVYVGNMARSLNGLYPLLLKARTDIKTIVLAAHDDEAGHEIARQALASLSAKGGAKILETFYFSRDMRDYNPVATKVASLKTDLFIIANFGGSAEKMGLMMKAFNESTYRGSILVTELPTMKDLAAICPSGEAEGLYGPLVDSTALPDAPPLALKIRKHYEQKYGEWRETGPYWTLPLWFYVAALQKAGSFDAAAIDKAMTGLAIDTPIGKVKMIKRPDLGNMRYCDTIANLTLAQVKGSKSVPVVSTSMSDGISAMEQAFGFKGQWE